MKINSRYGLVAFGTLVGAIALVFFLQGEKDPLSEPMGSAVDRRHAVPVSAVTVANERQKSTSEQKLALPRKDLARSLASLLDKIVTVDATSASSEDAERIAEALELWAEQNNLAPLEFYREFFHDLSESHPEWLMRLGVRMDPDGTGISAQSKALSILCDRDVKLALDLIKEFGPSGLRMKELMSPYTDTVVAANPSAFIEWLENNRDSELGRTLLEVLPIKLDRDSIPESVRLSLMREEAMPMNVRIAALSAHTERISTEDYRAWANQNADLLEKSEMVSPVLRSWPLQDLAGAEQLILQIKNPASVQKGWEAISYLISTKGSPDQVAALLLRAPAEFKSQGTEINTLYKRDPEIALETAALMASAGDMAKTMRWNLFLRTLREEPDPVFIRRVMSLETDPAQSAKMNEYVTERGIN